MNEWTLDTPIIDLPIDPDPQPPAAAPSRARRHLTRWQQSLIALAALAAGWSGLIILAAELLHANPLPYVLVCLAGMVVVWLMIVFIAWRAGRLV